MKPTKISETLTLFKDVLAKRKKYVSREHQAYGLELAKELHDWKNRSLYIRLAKNTDRQLLEQARLFVKDQTTGTVRSQARLFMWQLKKLKSAL